MHWFTADTHFDWERIQVNLRKFPNLNIANDTVLQGIHDCVKKDDHLWILGDFAHKETKWGQKLPKCHKHIVLGNHDNAHRCRMVFGGETYESNLIRKPALIYLFHYPMFVWDRSHYGSYQLYGHCHSAREEYLDNLFPDRKSMDVGVDNAHRLLGEWRPFSWEEIHEILKDRTGHDHVDWYRQQRGEI